MCIRDSYGTDLYGKSELPQLLNRLCEIDGLHWIRLLYCYPEGITDELLDTIAAQEKIVNYIDLPLQHASAPVLKAMNRRGSRAELTALIQKMRDKIPGLVLRTTLITGFPGETEEDFTELAEFVQEIRFERLGCFAYSIPAPFLLRGEPLRRAARRLSASVWAGLDVYKRQCCSCPMRC